DLRAAETFYRAVFSLEVLFRETQRDNAWWTLPPESKPDGVDMVALRRDDFVIALFRGTPQPGTLYEVSIGLPAGEIEGLQRHPPDGLRVVEEDHGFLRFDDPFGFRWVIQRPDAAFRSSGQIAGRWIDR